jgi:hypothetical protein
VWEPTPCGVIGGASVWYGFRAADPGTFVFDTQGSTFDTTLTVFRKVRLRNLSRNEVACNTDAQPGAKWSRVSFEAQRGSNYWVVVDGVGGSKGRLQLNWALGRAPQMVSNPKTETLHHLGQHMRWQAEVTNAIPNPSYQWHHDGRPIPGATNAWFELLEARLSDTGWYSVTASNAIGLVENRVVRLTLPPLLAEFDRPNRLYRLTVASSETSGRVLEASTDLIHWSPISYNTNLSDVLVTTNIPLTEPARFFRVRPWP